MRQTRNEKSGALTETIKEYIDLKLEYFQLNITEKISTLVGYIGFIIFISTLSISLVLLIILLGYNLLMAWIGIAWLVTLIEIFIVSLFILLLWIFREKLIVQPIGNIIARTLLKNDKDDEEGGDDE